MPDSNLDSLPFCQSGFICSICGEIAGLVQLYGDSQSLKIVRTGFLGKIEVHVPAAKHEVARSVISSGDVRAIFKYDLELVPSYCPKCEAIFCPKHWHFWDVFDTDDGSMWHDSIRGRYPHGHERMLED